MGLKAGIWALRLRYGPGGCGKGGVEEEKEKEEEEEKSPHICESIGHRPLRGRCPAPSLNFKHNILKQGTGTANRLTLLRLFILIDLIG